MAELDPKKLEARKIKRMRYFDGLFLRQEEFNLEQNYHVRMRRLHNLFLHSYGIAKGLEVTASQTSGSTVIISPGMALVQVLNNLDYDNMEAVIQEIVITDPASVDFSQRDLFGDQTQTTPKSITKFIYLSHSLEKTDIFDDRGGKEQIHWWEKAVIHCEAGIPEEKLANREIAVLAKVELAINGEIITVTKVSYTHAGNELRTYTGSYGNITLPVELDGSTTDTSPNPMIRGKKINGQNGILVDAPVTDFNGKISLTTNDIADEPYISGKVFTVTKGKDINGIEVKAPLTNVDGDFTINGNFTVIGGNSAHIFTQMVEVEDNILQINRYQSSLKPEQIPQTAGIEIYRGEKLEVAQLLWDEGKDRWLLGVKSNLIDISSLTDQSVIDIHRHNGLYTANSSPDPNGAPVLKVSDQGNIGIGTVNPLRKLQVEGDTLINSANSAGHVGLEVRGSGAGLGLHNGTVEWQLVNKSDNAFQVRNATNNTAPLTVKADAPVDGLVLTAAGIGIGTQNPQAKLEVSGGAIMPSSGNSVEAGLLFRSINFNTTDNAWIRHYFQSDTAIFDIGGSDVIALRPNANVGIGTLTPSVKLEVSGTVKADSFVGDGSQLTGVASSSQWSNVESGQSGVYYNQGNVGIGTNTPQARLDVNGALKVSNMILSADNKMTLNPWTDGSKHHNLNLYMDEIWTGEQTGYEFNIGHKEIYSFRSEEGGARYTFSKAFSVKETGDMFVKGNVGVGTEAPLAKLDVNGTFRVNNGTIFKKVQAGTVRVGKSDYDSYKNCTIGFPNSFLTNHPRIVLTPRYQGNQREFFIAMCRTTSQSQAEIAVMRLDRSGGWSQELIVDWYAWEEVVPYGAYGYGYGLDFNFEGIGGHLI